MYVLEQEVLVNMFYGERNDVSKGFALTLENEHDFKLEDFYAGPCETFHPYCGPKESGDIFDPDNEEAFTNLIMQHTHGKGVHFVMSD